ncbi:MAG: hypothetical protein NT078_00745 [Candidatus Azambacteria bacterium]|nr:hypothetical protein [Candidatus Azambacteria bacterium]
MKHRVLSLKFIKNAVLILAIISVFFPIKNIFAASKNYYFYNPTNTYLQYQFYSSYLNALKPYKKGFDESLKPGITLNTLVLTLLKSNLTFNDMEGLFKKKFSANPVCFSQGGSKTFPPGRVFSTPLCWDIDEDGCYSCACQCGYTGYIWDPQTSMCGCAQ